MTFEEFIDEARDFLFAFLVMTTVLALFFFLMRLFGQVGGYGTWKGRLVFLVIMILFWSPIIDKVVYMISMVRESEWWRRMSRLRALIGRAVMTVWMALAVLGAALLLTPEAGERVLKVVRAWLVP